MRGILLAALACAALATGVADAGAYDAVRIVAPTQDETVHDDNGNVTVIVDVSPPLDVRAGDRIVLLMDGKPVARGRAARFELEGLDRGTHVLQAQVTAAGGSALAASPQVSFHMWRASRLFPGRKD